MAEAFEATRAERVYLVEAQPYDPATGATVTLRLASKGLATGPAESPANVFYEPVLAEALTFKRSMYRPGAIGGRAVPDRGGLTIVGHPNRDAWLNYRWDGRAVTVRLGIAGSAYADFQTVFSGIMGEADYDRARIRVPLRDRGYLLDKPLQDTFYAGTGGAEGGDDLKDKPKPCCYGVAKNISPVPLGDDGLAFQFHDGASEAVDAVYVNGELAATPGDYTADLATSIITFGSAAAGLVTADVRGSKSGGVYLDDAAGIARRLILERSDLVEADLDEASFTALTAATDAAVGIYTGAAPVNLLDALDRVINSVGGFHGANRAGAYAVGRFEAPAGAPVLSLDENDMLLGGPVRESPGPVRWRQTIEWGPAWTVQFPDTLAAGASDAFKAFARQAFRTAKAEDADIKADGPGMGGEKGAIDPEPRQTLLAVEADATAEAARVLALYGQRRDVFRVPVKSRGFAADLGQTVRISHPRLGLAAGRDLVVVGTDERAAAGAVTLELWG